MSILLTFVISKYWICGCNYKIISFWNKLYRFMYVFFGIKAWTQIWDTSFMGSNLSLGLSRVSSWACLWNALSLSSQTQQNISKIWDKVSTFESDSRLKSVHETSPRCCFKLKSNDWECTNGRLKKEREKHSESARQCRRPITSNIINTILLIQTIIRISTICSLCH